MNAFFDGLWLYLKLLLLLPILGLGVTIVMFVIGGVITGASNVFGYIFTKLDAICTQNIILQKIWYMILAIGGIIVALGVIIAIISINIRSCNVDRYDSHLEWYRR